jgi:predicted ATPase
VDDALLERLMTKSDGNPLLVVQMLHAIEGRRSGSTSALLALGEMREAIALQLADLSSPTLAVLAGASVLGRELTLARLATTTGRSTVDLLAAVEESLAARVLTRTDTGGLRFMHALVRDVLYRRPTTAERVSLHRAAGIAALDDAEEDVAIAHFERALRALDRLRAAPEDTGEPFVRAKGLLALIDQR